MSGPRIQSVPSHRNHWLRGGPLSTSRPLCALCGYILLSTSTFFLIAQKESGQKEKGRRNRNAHAYTAPTRAGISMPSDSLIRKGQNNRIEIRTHGFIQPPHTASDFETLDTIYSGAPKSLATDNLRPVTQTPVIPECLHRESRIGVNRSSYRRRTYSGFPPTTCGNDSCDPTVLPAYRHRFPDPGFNLFRASEIIGCAGGRTYRAFNFRARTIIPTTYRTFRTEIRACAEAAQARAL
jgi:hypothetical protein